MTNAMAPIANNMEDAVFAPSDLDRNLYRFDSSVQVVNFKNGFALGGNVELVWWRSIAPVNPLALVMSPPAA